jgi:uncharacterized protein (TIGR03067 family)
MKKYWLMTLVAGMLLAADTNKGDAKKDGDLLQGSWRAVSIETGGNTLKPERDSVTTFENDTFTVKKGDVVQVKGTFKIDASKNPKTIDLTVTGGQVEGDKGKVVRGICQVDKEMLKWCTAEPGDETRPKEFTTKEGTKHSLIIFKKEKP